MLITLKNYPSGVGAAPAAAPGFTEGLLAWQHPSEAVSSLQTQVTNFNSANTTYLAGLAIPVLVLAAVVLGGVGGRRRR